MNSHSCLPICLSLHAVANDETRWVQLLPHGEFHGRDGRGPFKVVNAETIIRNSFEYAGGNAIPIDYDHQIDHAKANGQPAIAAGWIKRLEARADGVWGLVAWTGKAASHIAAKEYRFLSPVIGTSKSSGGAVDVILRAALTNNPNLTQLKAVAAMEAKTMDAFLKELIVLLGLPPETTEEQVLAAISENKPPAEQSKAVSSDKPDPTKWVPIADFEKVVGELNRLNQGIEKHAAETHVEDQINAGKLPPYLRNWAVELCCANKPQFDQFVDRTKRLYEPLFKSALSARLPDSKADELSAREQDAANRMNLTPEEFVRAKRGINA